MATVKRGTRRPILLDLLEAGHCLKQAAYICGISLHTVNFHINDLKRKIRSYGFQVRYWQTLVCWWKLFKLTGRKRKNAQDEFIEVLTLLRTQSDEGQLMLVLRELKSVSIPSNCVPLFESLKKLKELCQKHSPDAGI